MFLLPSETREAKLIEENLQNAFIAMSSIQKKYKNSVYIFSAIPHPVFNCVIAANATHDEAEDTIKAISEDYRKNNTPHCWWISDRSNPENFEYLLKKLNFQKGPSYRGMHLDLKKTHITLTESPSIRVEKISNLDSFDEWVKPIQESFEFSNEVTMAFVQCYKDLFVKDKRFISYCAFYEDQLAGVTTLFLDKDSAGLYNGAVFLKFRNKGIISQLGNTMLLEAKNQGVEEVVVQVSQDLYDLSVKAG